MHTTHSAKIQTEDFAGEETNINHQLRFFVKMKLFPPLIYDIMTNRGGFMEIFIYITLGTLIVFSLALVFTLSMHKNNNVATDGVINYDYAARKFVYKVNLTRDEIISILQTIRSDDALTCTFDSDMSTMIFSDLWDHEKYYLVVQNDVDFSILRLERVGLSSRRSQIKYKLNPFIVSKLNAEAVPFSEYGA